MRFLGNVAKNRFTGSLDFRYFHSLLSTGTPKQQHTTDICREADEWTMKELAQQLQMPEPTLYSWLCKGHIKGRQVKVASRSIWLLHADDMELEQLRKQRMTQRIWINQASDEMH